MTYLVAVPIHNEQDYIRRTLDQVRRYARDILVINDGSTDDTAQILAGYRDIHTITHPENRGYGQSLIDAFEFAHRRQYDWVITIDCDEQHEPAQIPEFVAEMRRDDADVISGSRYLVDFPDDDAPPEHRKRINHTLVDLIDQLTGLRLTDAFCGFKAHRVSAMSRLSLTEPGYAFPMQFWPRCVRDGLRIRELPVRRIYRDTSRYFGGTLDDPAARMQHYLTVLLNELNEQRCPTPSRESCCSLERNRPNQ
jgi:dolichol-phosphate mannosyltransferase